MLNIFQLVETKLLEIVNQLFPFTAKLPYGQLLYGKKCLWKSCLPCKDKAHSENLEPIRVTRYWVIYKNMWGLSQG